MRCPASTGPLLAAIAVDEDDETRMIEQMTARRDFITICTPCRYFPFRHGPPEVNKQGLSGRSFRRTSGDHDRRIRTGSSGHIVSGSCHHVKVILATGKAETLAVSPRIPKPLSPERAVPNFANPKTSSAILRQTTAPLITRRNARWKCTALSLSATAETVSEQHPQR